MTIARSTADAPPEYWEAATYGVEETFAIVHFFGATKSLPPAERLMV